MAKKKKSAQPKAQPPGRPTGYLAEYAQIAFQLTLLGATDAEMASAFDVDERTINRWKIQFPEFCQSIKRGKLKADGEVVGSLYKRALGFSAPDVHITAYEGVPIITPVEKYYPPDTTAQIFWLKNRQPKQFRDKPEVEVTVNNETTVDLTKPIEDWGRSELEAELRRRGALPTPPGANA